MYQLNIEPMGGEASRMEGALKWNTNLDNVLQIHCESVEISYFAF